MYKFRLAVIIHTTKKIGAIMFNSPFAQEFTAIPADAEIVFVADLFVEDYVGGAELTSEALIKSSPFKVHKIHSKDVKIEHLSSAHDKYWIFGNFAQLDPQLIPSIAANINYSILEYDYKYCKWRSPQKHELAESKPCDDAASIHGKMISAFMYGAKSLWWMSEAQMDHYHSLYPFLAEKPNTVLSSVFDDEFFVALKFLRQSQEQETRKGWIVLGSTSWVKGADDAEEYCKSNNLDYEIVWNIPHADVLKKLSTAEGFVYLPKGWDTCPRMVIEAKLLGCKLITNDNVQHSKEIWFDTDNLLEIEEYLYAARQLFWNGIKHAIEWVPRISGYTTAYNFINSTYPWKQCIESMLGFCSEVVVVDGGSNDGTLEALQDWASREDRLKVYEVPRDWNDSRFGVFDGMQKAEARSRCTGDFLWQQDADEVVHERDYDKIVKLCKNFPDVVDIVALPVIEYWGGPEKVRVDVNPWKWRLSRNKPNITHGIPGALRKHDDEGKLYAAQGTDGCDYIYKDTLDLVPHANFYTQDVHNARIAALNGNSQALEAYSQWFKNVTDSLPSVYHYSWFNLERKIRSYKNFWTKFWQSLYNIKQEDVAENNMFFQRPWTTVTDNDITEMAEKLKNEMGGWIFHSPVDFNRKTPSMKLSSDQPKVMIEQK